MRTNVAIDLEYTSTKMYTLHICTEVFAEAGNLPTLKCCTRLVKKNNV